MKELDSRKLSQISNLAITYNDRYFYLKTRPEDRTGRLYYRNGYKGEEVMLFDPQTYEAGKTYTISFVSPSLDGSKVAFGIAGKGSEQATTLIMEVSNKKMYAEKIDRCWLGEPSWLPGNAGFLYTRLNSSNVADKAFMLNSKNYLHQPGTDPATDKELFSKALYPELKMQESDFPYAFYDQDSKRLFALLGSVRRFFYWYTAPLSELDKEKINWQPLFTPEDQVTNWFTTDKELYFSTAKNASRLKIMRMPVSSPDVKKAELVVPESDEVLNNMVYAKDGLYFVKTRNSVQANLYHVPAGTKKILPISLPGAAGTLKIRSKNFFSPDLWITLSGWLTDSKRFRYLPATKQFVSEPLSTEAQYPEFNDFVVEEITVPSHDGEQVPLTIVYKKGLVRNGSTSLIMTGYGAYGSSYSPYLSAPPLTYVLNGGGIMAVAHVRGGGEKGEAWHQAGFKTTKPNTWKDFIACAEYLIKNGYCRWQCRGYFNWQSHNRTSRPFCCSYTAGRSPKSSTL